ncbi:MAG TPA: FtsX-like permease family protein [Aggregatilineales bacterium]|nr:FtsX-like permease family protein [Aggregatilineales bacterium]
MKHLAFYVRFAWRDMTRNGRRTAFALFCIAAGVAAIVALRSLSLMIADSLTINLAGVNHGDLRASLAIQGDNLVGNFSGPDGRSAFSPELVKQVDDWAAANDIQTTNVITDANIQVAPMDNQQNVGRPQFISSYLIDPAVYPFYGEVTALDPPGTPLSKLFTGGNDVVISQNLAQNNGIKVGDQVRVGRTTQPFTVRGIVPTDVEGNLRNPLAAFFGFAFFNIAQAPTFQLDPNPDVIDMRARPGANVDALAASLNTAVPGLDIRTTTDVRQQNQAVSDVIDRLIVIMGLSALLIGGMGIIHTMLVVVSRRTVEIAVLKTSGVQARQITLMFLIESAIMGLLGSIGGALLGIIFSLGVRAFTQTVWPQSLPWAVYPEALIQGIVLGVVVTTTFGFLPTLAAASVRPAVVLRPNENTLPRTGCLSTILALAVLIVVVGIIAGQLVHSLLIGLLLVWVTAIFLGFAVGILWFMIAIISHFPAFGSVDLRLALRGISTHRGRTASTLLALIVGVFSLSAITLVAASIPSLLNIQLSNALGANVIVLEIVPALQRPFVVAQLKASPGVKTYNQVGAYIGKLAEVNGSADFLNTIPSSNQVIPFGGKNSPRLTAGDMMAQKFGSFSTVDVTAQGFQGATVQEGRSLNAQDSKQHNAILNTMSAANPFGLKVGDQVTFAIGNNNVTFTIVGIKSDQPPLFGAFTVPVDALPPGLSPTFEFATAEVDEAHLNQTLVNLSTVPGVFPIDLSFIETLLRRLLSLFTAIPTVVAVLSLFAGAVIIANTVSLATLERRREVGVMKTVGLKGWRVLAQMVLENGLIGLLGGLIGVGIGVIMTVLFTLGSNISIFQAVSWGAVGWLVLLPLAISVGATLLSAWTAATEKPLHVLRYE